MSRSQRQLGGMASLGAGEAAVTQALREHGPLTRTDLAAVTGWSRATVSTTVQALLHEGQVSEERGGNRTDRGRPATVVRIDPTRVDVVGLEIGRGHIAAAAADGADVLTGEAARSVAADTTIVERTAAALDLLAELVTEHRAHLSKVRAIAVGTPGPRFSTSGPQTNDLPLTRIGHERSEVVDLLTERFRVPVDVSNNTRCTALGEATSGVAAGASDMLYLRVDEGIGGGIVAGGTVLEGHWDTAGELGHVVVDPGGRRCACGGRGCLETIAAMPVLLAATGEPDAGTLAENLRRGVDYAEVTRAAWAVAQVLSGALATVDSSIVVLGGGVARLPGFLTLVTDHVFDLAPSWCLADLAIRTAEDDRTAGARGCLVQARARLEGLGS